MSGEISVQIGWYVDESPAYAAVPMANWPAPSWPDGSLPGTVGSGKSSLSRLTGYDPNCAGCTYDGHADDFAPAHTCGGAR